MPAAKSKNSAEQVAKYADMFTAMGTEPRLRIMQLLLFAHPEGLNVGEIQSELGIPNSTLSHHLDSSRARIWLLCAGRARFSGTPPIAKCSRNYSASCMPSAARATRPLSRRRSYACVGKGERIRWKYER